MAIKIDENLSGNVTYDNPPEIERTLFKNLKEGGVQNVTINGTSIVDDNGEADIPIATTQNAGVILIGPAASGIEKDSGNFLKVLGSTVAGTKTATDIRRPVTPSIQHAAAFYGLAKAAGDTTQAESDNAVGNYTDQAKIAIQKMLGVYEAPYRLITERTITEETGIITVLTDDNNNSFELTEVIVLFDSVVSGNIGNGAITINNPSASATNANLVLSNLYHTTAQTRSAYLSVRGGRFIGIGTSSNLADFYSLVSLQTNKTGFGFIESGKILEFSIMSLNSYKFTSGKITVYGR